MNSLFFKQISFLPSTNLRFLGAFRLFPVITYLFIIQIKKKTRNSSCDGNFTFLPILIRSMSSLQSMEIAPERHEVEYINKKYLKNLSVVFRKFSRNSPLYVSMELESLVGVGDNMTVCIVEFFWRFKTTYFSCMEFRVWNLSTATTNVTFSVSYVLFKII